jgi:hypothetical protein
MPADLRASLDKLKGWKAWERESLTRLSLRATDSQGYPDELTRVAQLP